jgi:hypothetical protein
MPAAEQIENLPPTNFGIFKAFYFFMLRSTPQG